MKMTDLHVRQKVIIYLMHINQRKENNQNYVPETVAEQPDSEEREQSTVF